MNSFDLEASGSAPVSNEAAFTSDDTTFLHSFQEPQEWWRHRRWGWRRWSWWR